MIFNWNAYVSEQIRWAECLFDKAGEMQGVDADALYLIARTRLEDARRIQNSETAPNET